MEALSNSQSSLPPSEPPEPAVQEDGTLAAADRRHIIAALEKANWVIAGPNGAAARLGVKRSTLQFRMRKLGIVRPALQH
jgi:formate hydrogenlyase transcriptional activator